MERVVNVVPYNSVITELIMRPSHSSTEPMWHATPAIPLQFASRSYFSYNNYFVLLFFELDKVGGDNGRFRLTPTRVSTAKGIILAIESAERVNPAALLVGHHCVAKEPKIMDLAYNF